MGTPRRMRLVLAGVVTAVLLAASAGASTAAVDLTGEGYGWGFNIWGNLGNGTQTSSNTPSTVDASGLLAGKTLALMAAGTTHSCTLDTDGVAYCWGDNFDGGLGNGANNDSKVPVAVSTSGVLAGKTLTTMASGEGQTCAIDDAGLAYCWGYGESGQLGNGAKTSSNVPVAVNTSGALAGKTLVSIGSGLVQTCAVATDGRAYCWGGNGTGELGNGTNTNSSLPVAVKSNGALAGKTLTSVSASKNYACALDSDGHAYCWGDNLKGQLGDGTTSDSNEPVAVSTSGALAGKSLVAIATGSTHTCAVDSSGQAYCWGSSDYGELGDGTYGFSDVPVPVNTDGVLAGKTLVAIATGSHHSCAADLEGRAYCWGFNLNGELGNGTNGANAGSTVPVAVVPDGALAGKAVVSLSASGGYTMAVAATAYPLSYSANGGTGTPAPDASYPAGQQFTTSAGSWATRPGYSLTGWNTAADGTGTAVGPGELFTMPDESTTLYAQWAADPTPDPTPTPYPTPTPTPTPTPKQPQVPADGRGKPPKRIKKTGVTVITGTNALTNAGQAIRTEVRCLHRAAPQRFCTVIRGAGGKVSLRTYGRKVQVIVVQSAPATETFDAYRLRSVYGKRGRVPHPLCAGERRC